MEKIYLEKGEHLYNEPNRVVCVTGEYTPDELVLVGELNNLIYPPDFPLYQYPASYIKTGEIKNIDSPDSEDDHILEN